MQARRLRPRVLRRDIAASPMGKELDDLSPREGLPNARTLRYEWVCWPPGLGALALPMSVLSLPAVRLADALLGLRLNVTDAGLDEPT
jgi:hypothetical protein